MKNILGVFFGLLFFTTSYCQETYNHRLDFDRPVPTVMTSIVVNDSCYYVSGITIDSVAPFNTRILFAKMSLEGEVVWYKTMFDSFANYSAWKNTLMRTEDNGFAIAGNYVDTLGAAIIFIKLDSIGDTLVTKKYFSPYSSIDDFIRLVDSRKTEDNGYLLLSNINSPTSYTDLYLIKIDSVGNVLWDRIYGGDGLSESGKSIELINDRIVIGAYSHNTNFATNNFTSRTYVFGIDSVQNIGWEYATPENEFWGSANDILRTEDGGLLVASWKGVEVPDNAYYSHLEWDNHLLKLDVNHNYEWGVSYQDSFASGGDYFNKLITPSDQSGYVTVGQIYKPKLAENTYDLFGVISKISLAGDSLWTRYYHHVVSPFDQHDLYDVEETPDGGFIMVGQATDLLQVAEQPLQRAWIVKVDQYGCLVPGCHLLSDVTEPGAALDIQVNIYPNPTSNYLNIYFRHPAMKDKAVFDLLDASGKSVLQFESGHGDITHMVDVSELAAGSYWLTCRVGQEVLSKEVVIVR